MALTKGSLYTAAIQTSLDRLAAVKKKKFALSEQPEENNALCAAFVTLNRAEMFLFPMGTSIFPIHCHYDQEQFKAMCKEDCTSYRSKVSVLGAIQISFPFVLFAFQSLTKHEKR